MQKHVKIVWITTMEVKMATFGHQLQALAYMKSIQAYQD